MDHEYQRLLARDQNPLSFLYGGECSAWTITTVSLCALAHPCAGFRRGWATYESIYLFAKLTTLLLTAVIDPNNCLFRTAPREKVEVARQIMLLVAMLVFFALQCIFAPFMDPVNNASEWFSRLNYVLTSAASLAVALDIPGQDIFNGPVLYVYVDLFHVQCCFLTAVSPESIS